MIYVDTSVILAHLLGEERCPPETLWKKRLVSSRLLEYEVWVVTNVRGLTRSHGEKVRYILEGIDLAELSPVVLARVLDPFPTPVRTLDAIHLATAEYLHSQRGPISLASYDERLNQAAKALGIPLFDA